MDGAGTGGRYITPVVSDYGDLLTLTADSGVLLHVGMRSAGLNAASVPGGGGGPGGDVVTRERTLGETSQGDVLGGEPTSGGDGGDGDNGGDGGGAAGGGAGGGGGSGGGGGGGKLPFTGFGAALVGAMGAGMSAAGLAMRKALGRGEPPGGG